MKTTQNLKLPQYTGEDIFDLQDVNKAYDSIDKAYGNIDDTYKKVVNIKDEIPKTNATAEVINARGGKETLGKRLDEFGSQLDTIKTSVTFITPEMFGAIGDGENDDTEKVKDALDYALNNNLPFVGNKIYKTTSIIEIDCNGKNLDFTGCFKCTKEGFKLKNIINGNIKIRFLGGGNNDITCNALILDDNLKNLKIDVMGDGYKGTVLKHNGLTTNMLNIKLTAKSGCLRCLEHGNNAATNTTNAFGTYENVYDFDSTYGSVFYKATDVTIKHYENHFYDTTFTKNSLEFINCGVIHIDNLAIGGCAKYLLNCNGVTMSCNKIFTMEEDGDNKITEAINLENASYVFCNYLKDGGCKKVINLKNITSWVNFSTIQGGNNESIIIMKDNVNLNHPVITSYNNINNLKSFSISRNSPDDNNYLDFLNLIDNTKKHYSIGENKELNDFRIEYYNDNGVWQGIPFRILNDGRVNLATTSTVLGFYGTYGTTQRQAKPSATDLESALTLVNDIRIALITLGLLKE